MLDTVLASKAAKAEEPSEPLPQHKVEVEVLVFLLVDLPWLPALLIDLVAHLALARAIVLVPCSRPVSSPQQRHWKKTPKGAPHGKNWHQVPR